MCNNEQSYKQYVMHCLFLILQFLRLRYLHNLSAPVFRTPITQMIFFNQGMFMLGSNQQRVRSKCPKFTCKEKYGGYPFVLIPEQHQSNVP